MARVRVGILISGRGSNMVALAEAVRDGVVPDTEIAIVLSDKASASGLARAAELGLETKTVERRGRRRDEHDREVVAVLTDRGVNLICLAGYMRVLSSEFLEAFHHRILNIHPSLLPAFPGLNAQLQAIEHGVQFSGCTVHFVDETLDGGPIIAQEIVRVDENETEESLSARILEKEHQLYPKALALIASGKYEIVGRRVIRR